MVDTEVTDLYPSPDTDKTLEQWKHDPEHARWVDHANDRPSTTMQLLRRISQIP